MGESEEMRVSGEMVGGFTHKIRSPLAAMKLSVEVLLDELPLKDNDREVLLKVVEEIKRIELLMKNFLDFARPSRPSPMILNLNNIVEETAKFLEKGPLFSGEAQKLIVRELDGTMPDIWGDPQELQRVFLNIFLNAAEAMPDKGTVTVTTLFNAAAKTIHITVSDTGKGIPEESMDRVFQPFFSTKARGSGLGLAVAKRIIEEHGGNITARPNAAGGAVIEILLPLRQ